MKAAYYNKGGRTELLVAALAGLGLLAAAGWLAADEQRGQQEASEKKPAAEPEAAEEGAMPEKITKTDAEWRAELSPEQYRVLRQQGTEPAFSGAYWNHHAEGIYRCAGCGLVLYSAADKFDSGTGWPSFTRAIEPGHLQRLDDRSYGMVRTELRCARCGGHLGHVFDDGPAPTGQRHCINSAALEFEPDER